MKAFHRFVILLLALSCLPSARGRQASPATGHWEGSITLPGTELAIREGIPGGGNARWAMQELPGLNHRFQTCTTGAIAEYDQIEETFHPDALSAVSNWIRQQTGLK